MVTKTGSGGEWPGVPRHAGESLSLRGADALGDLVACDLADEQVVHVLFP